MEWPRWQLHLHTWWLWSNVDATVGKVAQTITVEYVAARRAGGSYDAAGRFRPRYYQVFMDGARVAWIGRKRHGLWMLIRVRQRSYEPLVQGSLPAVRGWLREHVAELARQ